MVTVFTFITEIREFLNNFNYQFFPLDNGSRSNLFVHIRQKVCSHEITMLCATSQESINFVCSIEFIFLPKILQLHFCCPYIGWCYFSSYPCFLLRPKHGTSLKLTLLLITLRTLSGHYQIFKLNNPMKMIDNNENIPYKTSLLSLES